RSVSCSRSSSGRAGEALAVLPDRARVAARPTSKTHRRTELAASLGGDIENQDRVAARERLVVRRERVLQGERVYHRRLAAVGAAHRRPPQRQGVAQRMLELRPQVVLAQEDRAGAAVL